MKTWIKAAAVALVAAMLFFAPAIVKGAANGLRVFAFSALPALLPFFVAARLFVRSGAANALARPLNCLWRAYGLSEDAGGVVLASLVSGYPAGASMTAMLANESRISTEQARTLSVLASNPGPLFVVSAVGGILGDAVIGWAMLGACAIGSFASAAFFAAPFDAKTTSKRPVPAPGFPAMLTEALSQSCTSLLPVGAVMTFWGAISEMIGQLGLERSPELNAVVTSVLEMVSGCAASASIPAPLYVRAALCCFAISFGGLSVQTQSLAFLLPAGVPVGPFIAGKTLCALISIGAFTCIMRFISGEGTIPLWPMTALCTALIALALRYFLNIPWSSWRLRRT